MIGNIGNGHSPYTCAHDEYMGIYSHLHYQHIQTKNAVLKDGSFYVLIIIVPVLEPVAFIHKRLIERQLMLDFGQYEVIEITNWSHE